MKNSGIAYLLALLGFLTPAAGVHRFYLGRPVSGILYFLTWGFLGIGTLVDLFLIQGMVDEENRKLLQAGASYGMPLLPAPTFEHHILRIAKENGGSVTVEMVALHSGMSLQQAKTELERLREQGYCSVDISTEGAKLYVFEGLRSNTPFELT